MKSSGESSVQEINLASTKRKRTLFFCFFRAIRAGWAVFTLW